MESISNNYHRVFPRESSVRESFAPDQIHRFSLHLFDNETHSNSISQADQNIAGAAAAAAGSNVLPSARFNGQESVGTTTQQPSDSSEVPHRSKKGGQPYTISQDENSSNSSRINSGKSQQNLAQKNTDNQHKATEQPQSSLHYQQQQSLQQLLLIGQTEPLTNTVVKDKSSSDFQEDSRKQSHRQLPKKLAFEPSDFQEQQQQQVQPLPYINFAKAKENSANNKANFAFESKDLKVDQSQNSSQQQQYLIPEKYQPTHHNHQKNNRATGIRSNSAECATKSPSYYYNHQTEAQNNFEDLKKQNKRRPPHHIMSVHYENDENEDKENMNPFFNNSNNNNRHPQHFAPLQINIEMKKPAPRVSSNISLTTIEAGTSAAPTPTNNNNFLNENQNNSHSNIQITNPLSNLNVNSSIDQGTAAIMHGQRKRHRQQSRGHSANFSLETSSILHVAGAADISDASLMAIPFLQKQLQIHTGFPNQIINPSGNISNNNNNNNVFTSNGNKNLHHLNYNMNNSLPSLDLFSLPASNTHNQSTLTNHLRDILPPMNLLQNSTVNQPNNLLLQQSSANQANKPYLIQDSELIQQQQQPKNYFQNYEQQSQAQLSSSQMQFSATGTGQLDADGIKHHRFNLTKSHSYDESYQKRNYTETSPNNASIGARQATEQSTSFHSVARQSFVGLMSSKKMTSQLHQLQLQLQQQQQQQQQQSQYQPISSQQVNNAQHDEIYQLLLAERRTNTRLESTLHKRSQMAQQYFSMIELLKANVEEKDREIQEMLAMHAEQLRDVEASHQHSRIDAQQIAKALEINNMLMTENENLIAENTLLRQQNTHLAADLNELTEKSSSAHLSFQTTIQTLENQIKIYEQQQQQQQQSYLSQQQSLLNQNKHRSMQSKQSQFEQQQHPQQLSQQQQQQQSQHNQNNSCEKSFNQNIKSRNTRSLSGNTSQSNSILISHHYMSTGIVEDQGQQQQQQQCNSHQSQQQASSTINQSKSLKQISQHSLTDNSFRSLYEKLRQILNVKHESELVKRIQDIQDEHSSTKQFVDCVTTMVKKCAPAGFFASNENVSLKQSWKFLKSVMSKYVALKIHASDDTLLAERLSDILQVRSPDDIVKSVTMLLNKSPNSIQSCSTLRAAAAAPAVTIGGNSSTNKSHRGGTTVTTTAGTSNQQSSNALAVTYKQQQQYQSGRNNNNNNNHEETSMMSSHFDSHHFNNINQHQTSICSYANPNESKFIDLSRQYINPRHFHSQSVHQNHHYVSQQHQSQNHNSSVNRNNTSHEFKRVSTTATSTSPSLLTNQRTTAETLSTAAAMYSNGITPATAFTSVAETSTVPKNCFLVKNIL